MITETEGAQRLRRKTALILIGLLMMAGMACPTLQKSYSTEDGKQKTSIKTTFFDFRAMTATKALGGFLTIAPAVIGLLMVVAAAIPIPGFIRGGILVVLAVSFWLIATIWSEGTLAWLSPGAVEKKYRAGMVAMSVLAFLGWAGILAGARGRRHSSGSLTAYAVGALGAILFLIAALLPVIPVWDRSRETTTSLVGFVIKFIDALLQTKDAPKAVDVAVPVLTAAFVFGILAAGVVALLNIPGRWRATVPLARLTSWLTILAPLCVTAAMTVSIFGRDTDAVAIPIAVAFFAKHFFLLDLPFLLVPLALADLLLGVVGWTAPVAATMPSEPASPWQTPSPRPPQAPPAPAHEHPTTPRDRLLDLDRLLKEGLITQEEHARKREEIIKEL